MNYEEALSWINQFQQFGMRLGLDRIKEVLQLLHNPHESLQCIHVAGTNGKGSVCRFISNILRAEGYKVGLYLSPHLINFNERFQLNNSLISENCLIDIIQSIRSTIEEYVHHTAQLTYFEICTIIAFVFFKKSKVDYAVIEVGLGGRCDATNVITPLVSVITNVSLDHQKHLGFKITDIAREKAGIIKNKVPVITAATGSALSVIKEICEKRNSNLKVVTIDDYIIKQSSSRFQTILYHGSFEDYTIITHQLGSFQANNISVCIATIEMLQQQGVFITKDSILKGIKEMNHPGRMQILRKKPMLIVDGAHNPEGMKQSVKSIHDSFVFNRLIVLFGVMKDKAIKNMLKELVELTDVFIISKPNIDRSADIKTVEELIKELNFSNQIIITGTIQEAHEKAINIAYKNDIIFATGSLFTVAEILQLYGTN